MSYNNNHKVRLKDLKSLALRVKAVTDELSNEVSELQELASSLLTLGNAVITNIERGEVSV